MLDRFGATQTGLSIEGGAIEPGIRGQAEQDLLPKIMYLSIRWQWSALNSLTIKLAYE